MQFLDTFKEATKEAIERIHNEMALRGTSEVFLLFPLGSQFDHLIKMALEKIGVFCLVADPASVKWADVVKLKPIGLILSGGPSSVIEDEIPFDRTILDLDIPVLGICLGFQLWAHYIGQSVEAGIKKEFGRHQMFVKPSDSLLFANVPNSQVLQNHGDIICNSNGVLEILAQSEHSPVAAARHKHLYGVQFHPEVSDTEYGIQIFENFCFGICKALFRFPAESAATLKIDELRQQIGGGKVLVALSGGSDSCTAVYLLKKALGKNQIKAVYIKGIDRPDDEAHVLKYFSKEDWLDLSIVDASEAFLKVLAGKITMHAKRVAMRSVYKEVLEAEAQKYGAAFIVQGTLYTDISESGHGYDSALSKGQIKLHHNVNLEFSVPEICPLNDCVKDTGRNIGRAIGVPEELLTRHPFPGPGLVVRIENEITKEKLEMERAVTEEDALDMHHVMETSTPTLKYLTSDTHRILKEITALRESEHLPVLYTMDAGPTVHLICESDAVKTVQEFAETQKKYGCSVFVTKVGPGATIL
jgi:GMP synthase (glutamine-hydrolysing)